MATAARTPDSSFSELDPVLLRSAVYDERGTLPIGALGTVVFRHDRDDAYEVEFAEPFPAVVTLRGSDLAPSP